MLGSLCHLLQALLYRKNLYSPDSILPDMNILGKWTVCRSFYAACCVNVEVKPCRDNLKNVSGVDRHGKELSQIRRGEVMFLDKTEPDVVSVISLKKIKLWYAIFCVGCWVQLLTQLSYQKKLMENVAVEKTGTGMEEL